MILFLTTADTEILALRSIAEGLPAELGGVRAANPSRLQGPPSLESVDVVVVRLLGGRRAWPEGFDALAAAAASAAVPLVALGGEATLDEELAAASTVARPTLETVFAYVAEGGLGNLEQALRYLGVTLAGLDLDVRPPEPVPEVGVLERSRPAAAGEAVLAPPASPAPAGRPKVGVVFYRAHLVAGNVDFVEQLCQAIEARGCEAVAVWCYSLRPRVPGGPVAALELLAEAGVSAVVATVWAGGGSAPAAGGIDAAGHRLAPGGGAVERDWDVAALARLGVPVLQAVAATTSEAEWLASTGGLSPLDAAMGVAIPELDGRIVGVPFAFKEVVDDGDELGTPVSAYRCRPDRVARVAGLACRLAGLARVPVAERRVAIVLSAYPTKRSRLGNAVGLDTPASAIRLLQALAGAGYLVKEIPPDGDALMAALADGLTYDRPEPSAEEVARAVGRYRVEEYEAAFARLDADFRRSVIERWGPAPGSVGLAGDTLVFAGLDLGGVVVAIQPPRGYGEDPIAVYHSPDLAPTHHYVGFYRWLDEVFGAHAVVHLGKHGTLEWLPGKGVGLSGACGPDAVLGDLPLVYPFVVNDPGEGTQAKRRAHAVVVDHLTPPLVRAETYEDLTRLEGLLDTHAQLAALDPTKLPAIRAEVWNLLEATSLTRDLGLDTVPDFADPSFDDLVLTIDGYLCELKDAQIRGGLHVLGEAPTGASLVDAVLACTRLAQGEVPSLRAHLAARLGIDPASNHRHEIDELEAACRAEVERLAAAGWEVESDDPTFRFICDRLVPALAGTTSEIPAVLGALDGRYVAAGPSGAPSRGAAHVLPTGRNFYALDPRAVPTPLAWDVGRRLAEALCAEHRDRSGHWPASVGLVVWGTSAMRTGGDDVAEVLALLGVEPVWSGATGRVEGLRVIPLESLGRPRVDVTVRISGFFRDAFPHVVALIDEAVDLVAALEEDHHANPVVAAGAGPRVFGPKPGAYGSGVLGVLESGGWRERSDLAAVWLEWSGWSYTRAAMGAAAGGALAERLAGVEVAAKNQDNREHDIFDSDDYLQDHGGMVAAVEAIRGSAPFAAFGDSANPERPRVRSLAEEAARVVRTRVLNPRWLDAMRSHGYKGAFEMAATVDYLFGYDATTGVVEDWMYEKVTEAYVADPRSREHFATSNPWALGAIAERLLEAASRGMWQASDEALATLRSALLESEGWEEGR